MSEAYLVYLVPAVLAGLVLLLVAYRIFKKIVGLVIGLALMACVIAMALGIITFGLPG